MTLTFADPLIPGSAGRRLLRELPERGVEDGLAGRQRTSESVSYNEAYAVASVKRRVLAREAIVGVAEGVECMDCGFDHVGCLMQCQCKVRDQSRNRAGMYVLFGMDCEFEPAEFRSMEFLRELTADGTPVVSVTGENITHRVNPIQ